MRRSLILVLLVSIAGTLTAQSISTSINENSQYFYERQMILNGKSGDDFLNLRPYDRKRMTENAYSIYRESPNAQLDFLLDENELFLYDMQEEKEDTDGFKPIDSNPEALLRARDNGPLLRYFFKTPAHFFQLDNEGQGGTYHLRVNPILHLAAGSETDSPFPFINQRGFQLDLNIGNKVYLSSNFLENQARFPSYITDYVENYRVIPGNSFYKRYKSVLFDSENAYDYMNSTAKLGFNIIKEIGLEFGYGKNHIGHGIRSLSLSDFSDNYLYLGLDTRIGRLAYQNIFGEIRGPKALRDPGSGMIPKKYFATHYLGVKILKNLQLGVFESVVFGRETGFELHYLNPVILYRTIEGALGSPDNMIMGIDARWDIAKRYSLYGQLVLDEFHSAQMLFKDDGWWANKFAFQLGAKAFNLLNVDGLDIHAEMNFIRPFMYSHKDYRTSWMHHDQALAHPRGANLREVLFNVRYSPTIKWDFTVTGMVFSQGLSPKDENYGDDPRLPYTSRSHDYGNDMFQGDRDDIFLIHGRASYMLWHGAYLDLNAQTRNSTISDKSSYFSLGFRWNADSQLFLQ